MAMSKVPTPNQYWSGTLAAAAGWSALLAVSAPVRPPAPPPPERIAMVDKIGDAEAVTYDPATDVYFVSDVNGNPGVKDGNGSIVRISGDGKLQDRHFIQGGQEGVTLTAPAGSRVPGDTLWVLGVGVLRGFDTRPGAPLGSIDFASAGALFLNYF